MKRSAFFYVQLYILSTLSLSGCSSVQVLDGVQTDNQSTELSASLDEVSEVEKMDDVTKASTYHKIGRNNDALYYYVSALQEDPKNTGILTAIGQIHFEKQNIELARKAYEMALEQDPDLLQAQVGMGLLLLKQKDLKKAERYLSFAHQKDPSIWKVTNALGLLFDQTGQHKKAQELYLEILKSHPKNVRVLTNLGYSKYMIGDIEASHLFTDQALMLDPKSESALMNKGLFLVKENRIEEALNVFRKTLSESDALNNLGFLLMLQGQRDSAREYFNRAIQVSPSYHVVAHANLSRLDTPEENESLGTRSTNSNAL
jgi:tetratricopeptide (TPR) repeat protein